MQELSNFRKISLIVVFLSMFSLMQVEAQQVGKSTLSPLMTFLTREVWTVGIDWEVTIAGRTTDEVPLPKSSEEILKDFEKWLQKKPEKSIDKEEISKYNLALKYKDNIKKVFDKLGLIGNETGKFLNDKNDIPIYFTEMNNNIVFFVTRVGSDKVFNTLRTSSKNRAAKIIQSMILPVMKSFQDSFKGSNIKYYGIIIGYGSKDFSDESDALNLRPEVLAFIVSSENCRKFSEGIITEDQLIDSADIYLSDRDMRHQIKKIKVTLE